MSKFLFSLLLLLFGWEVQAQNTLIPYQDSWRYLDNGSNQGTSWRDNSFNDSRWKVGNGKFGFGLSGLNTIIEDGKKVNYITTYFRKTINISNTASFKDYTFKVLRDDGVVVYVNGTEVYRNNMPTGNITYNTYAAAEATDNGSSEQTFMLAASAFVNGNNVIAVEIHQAATSANKVNENIKNTVDAGRNEEKGNRKITTDLAFDLQLTSIANVQPPVYGFGSITPLNSLIIKGTGNTQTKPQAKVWTYDSKWWCVFPTTAGFVIHRLDGTTWTPVSTINPSGFGRADCMVSGDKVYILLFKGGSNAFGTEKNSDFITVQYNNTTGSYSTIASSIITFPFGTETTTLTMDSKGTMWIAYDAVSDAGATTSQINVRSSIGDYSAWSAPTTLATNIDNDDICAIANLNTGNIGVFWSDQISQRFGFRTHTDGAAETDWSANEVPAAQSAINNIGSGMADNHMNLKVASNGTVYCAAKTGYDREGYARVILLVRQPNGVWDNAYTVTNNVANDPTVVANGTQAIVVLNEVQQRVKVVYTTITNGGDINYKESPTSSILFGAERTLINGGGTEYNFATSTNQIYNPDVVILASDKGVTTTQPDGTTTTTQQVVGVLASDAAPSGLRTTSGFVATPAYFAPLAIAGQQEALILKQAVLASPNPFLSTTKVIFTMQQTGPYSLNLYDNKGAKVAVIKQGWAAAGVKNIINVDGARLLKGMFILQLQTAKGSTTYKLLKQ